MLWKKLWKVLNTYVNNRIYNEICNTENREKPNIYGGNDNTIEKWRRKFHQKHKQKYAVDNF